MTATAVAVAAPRRRPPRFKEPLPCRLAHPPAGDLTTSRFNLEVFGGAAVYNTSTGNYVVLSDDEHRILDAALAGEAVADADGARLRVAGVLIPATVDEMAAVRQAFGLATGARYAPHLTIAPTMDCNFGCAYCFETHERGRMAPDVQHALVGFTERLLGTAGPDPALTVTWFGGEPLMAMDAIDALSRRFQALAATGQAGSYSADVITNGFGLSATVLDRLRAADVRQIQVTLDGPSWVHDRRRFLKASGAATFAAIVANLRRAVQRFRVVVRVNVDRTNADYVRDLFTELDDAGLLPAVTVDAARVEAFSAAAISAELFTAAEFAAWRNELASWCATRRWPLAAPPVEPHLMGVCQVDSINSFVVDPRGHLFKCWAELGTADAVPVGQLTDPSSWPEGAVGPLAQRDPFDDDGCRQCLLLPICLGSCPKTRAVGRQAAMPECPTIRHDIVQRVERRFGATTTIVRPMADPSPSTN
jgi:uncharacterized protein